MENGILVFEKWSVSSLGYTITVMQWRWNEQMADLSTGLSPAFFVMQVPDGRFSAFVGRLDFQAYMVTSRDRGIFRPVAFTAWQTFDPCIVVGMHEIADRYPA